MRGDGDAARFRVRLSLPPDVRLMLFLSRLHLIKGLPLLFEAMAGLRTAFEQWQLVVAGFEDRPGYLAELKRIAATFQVEDRIVWAGPLFGRDKEDAFAAADLFVLPTHSENFAIVVAEALAAGVPVLTTRGAPWEELRTRGCGWWADVNAESIKEALGEAAGTSKAKLVEMGARGRTLIAEKYMWPQVTRRTIELYDWLLGRSSRPEFVIVE
ncbi:MAG: glycosyltransferase [Planctomycetota bacterium]|nr:glycosyltransferase [Planctomycetota bacterium]